MRTVDVAFLISIYLASATQAQVQNSLSGDVSSASLGHSTTSPSFGVTSDPSIPPASSSSSSLTSSSPSIEATTTFPLIASVPSVLSQVGIPSSSVPSSASVNSTGFCFPNPSSPSTYSCSDPNSYCNISLMVCQTKLSLNAICSDSFQCASGNCLSGTCADATQSADSALISSSTSLGKGVIAALVICGIFVVGGAGLTVMRARHRARRAAAEPDFVFPRPSMAESQISSGVSGYPFAARQNAFASDQTVPQSFSSPAMAYQPFPQQRTPGYYSHQHQDLENPGYLPYQHQDLQNAGYIGSGPHQDLADGAAPYQHPDFLQNPAGFSPHENYNNFL